MSPVASATPSSAPAIRLDNVSLVYPTQAGAVTALDAVTWELPRGKSAAVIGRSGSGKSSLLAVISTMRRPTSGTIDILGQSVTGMNSSETARLRADSIGVVFQSYHLDLRERVWWNVALPWVFAGGGSVQQAKAQAAELLELVGLPGVVNRRASQLSGGQRQRVAIARALMSSPSLFIADEPTGNLDEQTANEVAEMMFGLTERGISVVVVTHDHEVAQRADSTVRLSQGRFVPNRSTGDRTTTQSSPTSPVASIPPSGPNQSEIGITQ